jgi:hypothetical protein
MSVDTKTGMSGKRIFGLRTLGKGKHWQDWRVKSANF